MSTIIFNSLSEPVSRDNGIDTPESKQNEKALRDSDRSGKDVDTIIAQGKQATAFMKSVLKKGYSVSLEFDVGRYDK